MLILLNIGGTKCSSDLAAVNVELKIFDLKSEAPAFRHGECHIDNVGNFNSIDSGEGKDTVNNIGSNFSINAGAGADYIFNVGAAGTINAGIGDDFLENHGDSNLIEMGEGNDSLENHDGSKISINLGAGKDYVESFGYSNTINTGANDDVVNNIGDFNFVDGDTGEDYIENFGSSNTVVSGADSDYILSVGDSNSLCGNSGSDIFEVSGTENTVSGDKDDDIINLLDGTANVIKYIKGDGNDIIYGFNSTSTLSISGAGYSSEKVGNDLILTVGSGKITLTNAASLTALNIDGTLLSGTYVMPSGKALIVDNSFKSPLALDDDISILDASKRTKAIKITGNAFDNSIFGGSGNDTLDGLGGNDTLTGGKGNDIFIYSGGNDIITDYAPADKISVGGGLTYDDYTISGNDVILSYGEDSLTIKDGMGKAITFTDKKVNIYSADGIFDSKNTSATLASTKETFSADKKLVTIDGSRASGVSILGNDKANKIIASKGGSTLNGGKGNDTLVGGNGTDVFVYMNKSGNKIIDNYGANDKISLGADVVISDVTMKKSDAVIKVGSNTLTVKNNSTITLTDGGKDTIFSNDLFVDDNAVKAPTSFKGKIDLSKYSVKIADASLVKGAVTIQGTASIDSILGGAGKDVLYGNAGADTLWGGKGNDTLYGGDGNDMFIFKSGEGSDTIMDYASGDLLQILKKDGSIGSFTKSDFNNATLTLKIEGGGLVAFKNVTSLTSFNINGETYQISVNKLTKMR